MGYGRKTRYRLVSESDVSDGSASEILTFETT